jgi:N-acetylglutamate synthase-like GNAT family acetyltransferase
MSVEFTIREATLADAAALDALLAECGLSSNAVLAAGTRYWLAQRGGEVIGVVGLELGAGTTPKNGGAALLRSAAVRPQARGQGIGAALLWWALDQARSGGYRRVYLFSTGAGAFWARQGFREVPVPELVAALPDAPQVLYYDQHGWLPDEVAWRKDLLVEHLDDRP